MSAPRPEGGRIRVLHIVQNLNYGGMERLLADLVRRCDPGRFECHVLALQYAGRFAAEMDPDRVHVAGTLPRWSFLWPRPLARHIRRLRPDVVHTHSGVWLKGTRSARLAGVRGVIHTDHGRRVPETSADRFLDRWSCRYTDTVVAVSDAIGAYLNDRIVADETPAWRPGFVDGQA